MVDYAPEVPRLGVGGGGVLVYAISGGWSPRGRGTILVDGRSMGGVCFL